jgi:hypothetical protein
LEVRYFDENYNESGDVVTTGMQLETQNPETEDASLVAEWQQHVGPKPVTNEWSDNDVDPKSQQMVCNSSICNETAWLTNLNDQHLKLWPGIHH